MGPSLAFQTAYGPTEIALALPSGSSTVQLLSVGDQTALHGQDARLTALLHDLLESGKVKLDAVNRIGVVIGPGSFTGLRMGIAFARGLGLVLRCPVVGVSLLQACLPRNSKGYLRVAIQAKKRPPEISFWCQDFDGETALSEPQERSLADIQQPGLQIFTDAPRCFTAQGPVAETRPDARRVADWAMHLDPALSPPSPIYARAPDASLPKVKML